MKVLAVLDFGGAENLLSTLAAVGPAHDLELSVVSLASATGQTATWLPALRNAGLEPTFLDLTRLAQPDALSSSRPGHPPVRLRHRARPPRGCCHVGAAGESAHRNALREHLPRRSGDPLERLFPIPPTFHNIDGYLDTVAPLFGTVTSLDEELNQPRDTDPDQPAIAG